MKKRRTPTQHHLPAVLIGQFGVGPDGTRPRERHVVVARRGVDGLFRKRAEAIGYLPESPQLYDLSTAQGHTSIDDLWAHAERRLPSVLSVLGAYDERRGLRADVFLLGLVPLVAQLLVRHPEFGERYADRVKTCPMHDHPPVDPEDDRNNWARYVDYLCLSGVAADARWWLLSAPAAEAFVQSDLGFAGATVLMPSGRMDGYVFPLTPSVAVYVSTGAPSYGGGRKARLYSRELTTAEVANLNAGMAGWAPTMVFGREEAVVAAAADVWKSMAGRSEYAGTVPAALLSHDAPLLKKEMALGFLRTLHNVQPLFMPTFPVEPFASCSHCRPVRRMLDWFFAGHEEVETAN